MDSATSGVVATPHALTGYGEETDGLLTREAGFHAHLVKPATVNEILSCIAEQLAATT